MVLPPLPDVRRAVTEPYAMTNSDESEVIHDREVYNRANAVERGGSLTDMPFSCTSIVFAIRKICRNSRRNLVIVTNFDVDENTGPSRVCYEIRT